MQPKLPPLPSLSDEEWRALPQAEKNRLRELKRAHRRLEQEQARQPPAPGSGQMHGTPFRDTHGRELWIADRYLGASCFIILSGPSLLSHDLSLLRRRGIFTFGVNNSPSIFRPNAWTCVDPPEKFHSSIWLDPGITKFVNARRVDHRLREKCGEEFRPLCRADRKQAIVRDMPNVVLTVRQANFEPSRWLSEPSINWGNDKRNARKNRHPRDLNVMLCALKTVYALGFRAVYLLGCDFTMQPEQCYAFPTQKDRSQAESNNAKYERVGQMLALLKPHFDAAGFHVFNCFEKSGLTVFPHIPFTEAIGAATAHVPQDPLDTMDWYRK